MPELLNLPAVFDRIRKPANRRLPGPYARKTAILIAFMFLVHGLMAFGLELGNDESYYWMYSQDLKSNYFDHPPMVAILIRIFTLNGLLDSPGWLRLGALVCSAAATWFLFRALSELHTARAGFYAGLLYNASFYAGVTAGVYIMPDSPQMLFWTLSLWMLVRIHRSERGWTNWLCFGAAAGAAIMSKVHGAFLWGGFGAYILLHRRQWLLLPQLYVAALLTALIISPILYWNIENNFITYRFHSRRVTIDNFEIRMAGILREAIGQLVFNNPVNVVLIGIGLWQWRRIPAAQKPALQLFNWIALPHAGFLLFISLYRDTTLPHWSGPAYITLLPLAALRLAAQHKRRFLPRVLSASLLLFLLVLGGWAGVVHAYPGTYGNQKAGDLGTGDISLDLYGWEEAGTAFQERYAREVAQGRLTPNTPVVASYWWGAHVEYYFCRPGAIPFRAVGPVADIREYYWRNATRTDRPPMDTALCILAADEHYGLPEEYRKAQLLFRIEAFRGGKPAHAFDVYRLTR